MQLEQYVVVGVTQRRHDVADRPVYRPGERLEGRISRLSTEFERRLAPFAAALAALDTIPGVGRRTAEEVVAEIGTDMAGSPVRASRQRVMTLQATAHLAAAQRAA